MDGPGRSEPSPDEPGEGDWAGVARRVYTVDTEHLDTLFGLVLLSFTGTLVVLAFDFERLTRSFPIAIGVPTFLLLLVVVGTNVSTRLDAVVQRYKQSELLDVEDRIESFDSDVAPAGGAEEADGPTTLVVRKRLVHLLVWIGLFFTATLLVGQLVAIPLFLVPYYRIQTGVSWLATAVYTALITGFVVVVFRFILQMPFYAGVLDVGQHLRL